MGRRVNEVERLVEVEPSRRRQKVVGVEGAALLRRRKLQIVMKAHRNPARGEEEDPRSRELQFAGIDFEILFSF